jgi:hypothetical protein
MRLSVVILLTLIEFGTANIFSRHVGKSRLKKKNEVTSSIEQCFAFRGGASESEEKLKGTCIGIDLGTTYRYECF